MSLVIMKCPNCGANLKGQNNTFTCDSCGSTIINFIDPHINADIDLITIEEFKKKLQENSQSIVINLDNGNKVIDIDKMVINKNIEDATKCLEKGDYYGCFKLLQRVPNNNLKVARLVLLSELKCKDEYELALFGSLPKVDSFGDFFNFVMYESEYDRGVLNLEKFEKSYLQNNGLYKHLLSLCNDELKSLYYDIAHKSKIYANMFYEIFNVKKLVEVQLFEDAIAYSKAMCKKYSGTCYSWLMYFYVLFKSKCPDVKLSRWVSDSEDTYYARCGDPVFANYIYKILDRKSFEIMKECPDFSLTLTGEMGYSNIDKMPYVLYQLAFTINEFIERFPKEKDFEKYHKKWLKSTERYVKRGHCYVATCIYGTYDCPQVWTLRRYRDDTLGTTWYGRLFIRTYYAISPTLVKWFGKTKWFKKLWKGKLDRMVKKLQDNGVESTPYEDKEW